MASRWWANGVPSFSLSQNFFLRLIPKTFSFFISSQNFTFQIFLKTFSLLLMRNLAMVIVLCTCVFTFLHLNIVRSSNLLQVDFSPLIIFVFKALGREDAQSHFLYLFDFSPQCECNLCVCVFVCLCICVFDYCVQ